MVFMVRGKKIKDPWLSPQQKKLWDEMEKSALEIEKYYKKGEKK